MSRARGGLSRGDKVDGVLPAQHFYFIRSCRMSSGQNNHRRLLQLSGLAHRHMRTLPPPSLASFPQGQRDECKKQNCQQNYHNSTIIQTLFSGCRELSVSPLTELSAEVAAPLQSLISAPPLSPAFLVSLCSSVMQFQAHMVHFRLRYF